MLSQNPILVPSAPTATGVFLRAAVVAAQALKRFLLWPLHVARARRDFAILAAMSENELRDIGLARHDIANATALARDEDPTLLLAQAARETRANRFRAR